MIKKRIVILSLILLCSNVVRASDPSSAANDTSLAVPAALIDSASSAGPQDPNAALSVLANANTSVPPTPVLGSSTVMPFVSEVTPATEIGIEAKLAQLLGTAEQRATAAKIVLCAEMGDVTAAASLELAKAESFGASEAAIVKAAIAKYGDAADRGAAIDQIITNIEAEGRVVYAQCATAVGLELAVLEATAANLATVRTQLAAAKNGIVNNASYIVVQAPEAEAVKLLGYFNASNTTSKTVIEVAAGVGAVAAVAVTGRLLGFWKL